MFDVNAKVGHWPFRPVKQLDDSKYCLPGEEVKCSLFPVVCKCVPKKVDPPILIAW